MIKVGMDRLRVKTASDLQKREMVAPGYPCRNEIKDN